MKFTSISFSECVTQVDVSNPVVITEIRLEIVLFSGCSVARLSRLVWDEEVAGSNPATPTNKKGNFCRKFTFLKKGSFLFDSMRIESG